MRALVIALVLAQALPAAAKSKPKAPAKPAKPGAPQQPSPPPSLCSGDYADALPAEKAASILDAVKQPFVFAIRNTATYEHVYYGRDGKLRRAYLRSVVHGTAFAYRIVNGETQLVTNEHVASQPDVTDDEHAVEGVPTGSKKVREQLKGSIYGAVGPRSMQMWNKISEADFLRIFGIAREGFDGLRLAKMAEKVPARRAEEALDFLVEKGMDVRLGSDPVKHLTREMVLFQMKVYFALLELKKQFGLDRHPDNRLAGFRHRRRCRCHRRPGKTRHRTPFGFGIADAKIAIAQHREMHLSGNRRRALVERGQRLGGQIILRAAHGLGRHLKAERGGRQPVGLQCPGELQKCVRILAGQYDRLAAAPAHGAIRRALLADIVGTGFDANTLGLPRAIEGGRHAPVDRRLHNSRVRPGFLGPELDAQHIARDLALGGLAEMQHGCPLIGILRQR